MTLTTQQPKSGDEAYQQPLGAPTIWQNRLTPQAEGDFALSRFLSNQN